MKERYQRTTASRQRRGLTRLALLPLLALAACGSPPPPDHVVVDNSINVTIEAGGQRGAGPATIHRDDPRIPAAEKKIAALLGHPLGMEFDATLVKSFGEDLHRAYVSALEATASGLSSCQRSEPEAFAHGAERLRAVQLAYAPLGPGERSNTALAGATLSIGVRPGGSRLIEGHEFCQSFRRSLEEDRARRFADIDPAQVAPEDEAAYLEFLRLRASRHPSREGEQLDVLGRGARLARFRPHVTEPQVKRDADELLANFASILHDAMASQPGDARIVTALEEAHRAWIAWANEFGTALDTPERLDLARRLFRRRDPVHEQFTRGFDAPRFGLPSIERWLQDTAPDRPRDGKDELEDCLVNPLRRGAAPPELWFDGPCNGAVYSELARTPEGRRRLVKLLARWRNDVLVEAAVLHTLRDRGAEPALALIEALASDREATRVALRALAELGAWSNERRSAGEAELDADPFLAHVPVWWKSLPEQRPTLLYLLVRVGEQREGAVPWASLARFLGRPISAAELAGFLAEDARNAWYLPALASGLGPGWPRAKVFLAGIEAYLDAEIERQVRHGIGRTLERVVPVVCETGTRQDVVELSAALKQRAALFPSQRRELGPFIAQSPEQLCPRFGRQRNRRPDPETPSFGD